MLDEDEDRVGYRRPPKQHRFQPGKSGNPKGRPKGSRSFESIVSELLQKRIAITENGRSLKITAAEAIGRRLVQKAVVQGDIRAIEKLLQLKGPEPVRLDEILEPDDEKIIAGFLDRLGKGDDQ